MRTAYSKSQMRDWTVWKKVCRDSLHCNILLLTLWSKTTSVRENSLIIDSIVLSKLQILDWIIWIKHSRNSPHYRISLFASPSEKSHQFLFKELNSCKKISDDGLHHLKQGLQKLHTLQQISLNFRRFISVQPQSFIKWIVAKNLRSRTRPFERSPPDTSFLETNHSQLCWVKKLIQYAFTKNSCPEITDLGLSYLKDLLYACASLKNITFHVNQ